MMEMGPGTKVAISGASGFVGGALTRSLHADGVTVLPLVRREARAGEISWDPEGSRIDASSLEGVDAVVHLAGENIAGLWTPSKKRKIFESRAMGTRLLASTIAALRDPPKVLVSASGINYYGDAGEAEITEGDPPGDDFLARVCIAWENGTEPAASAGVRVVNTRFGLVLDRSGGALAMMMPVFRVGLGARLGDGRQWMSWISLTDVVRVIRHTLQSASIEGPVNAVAPEPIRNGEFTAALGKALHRPTILVLPKIALKVATGGMADALLLASQRAVPAILTRDGFGFEVPSIADLVGRGLDGGERVVQI